MITTSRTKWRKRAQDAEQRVAELETAAEEWKQLASVWRSQFHQLQDKMALNEVAAALTPTAEEPKDDDDAIH